MVGGIVASYQCSMWVRGFRIVIYPCGMWGISSQCLLWVRGLALENDSLAGGKAVESVSRGGRFVSLR